MTDDNRGPEAGFARDAPRGSKTILLVEDEQVIRDLVCEILEGAGYAVLPAASGPEALEICERERAAIDLVLTDAVMPGMRGRELVARATPFCPRAKVLYMSGYADDFVFSGDGRAVGAAFLPKPFTVGALTSAVRALLEGEG